MKGGGITAVPQPGSHPDTPRTPPAPPHGAFNPSMQRAAPSVLPSLHPSVRLSVHGVTWGGGGPGSTPPLLSLRPHGGGGGRVPGGPPGSVPAAANGSRGRKARKPRRRRGRRRRRRFGWLWPPGRPKGCRGGGQGVVHPLLFSPLLLFLLPGLQCRSAAGREALSDDRSGHVAPHGRAGLQRPPKGVWGPMGGTGGSAPPPGARGGSPSFLLGVIFVGGGGDLLWGAAEGGM